MATHVAGFGVPIGAAEGSPAHGPCSGKVTRERPAYSKVVRLPDTPEQIFVRKAAEKGVLRKDLPDEQSFRMAAAEALGAHPSGPAPRTQPRASIVTGTGFFVSENGYLITNNHVIEGGEKVVVKTRREELPASVVCADVAPPSCESPLRIIRTCFRVVKLGRDVARAKASTCWHNPSQLGV